MADTIGLNWIPDAASTKVYPVDTPKDKLDNRKKGTYSKLLFSFLESTTAHGLPRLVTSDSWFRRIFWLIVFCIAFGYFTFQCTVLVGNYFKYPIAVKISIINSQKVNFPAVTVCNMNMLKKDLAQDDWRYKDLVSIDKYAEFEINSLFGDSSNRRKRRDVSGKTQARSGSSPDTKLDGNGKHVRKAPGQSAVERAILKRLEPEMRDVMADIMKRRRVHLHNKKMSMAHAASSSPTGSDRPSYDTDNTNEFLNNNIELHNGSIPTNENEQLQGEELLALSVSAGHETKSREKRQAVQDEMNSSGDDNQQINWKTWFDEDDYGETNYDYSDYTDGGWEDDTDGGDEYDWEEFAFEDYGFAGKVKNDYKFKQFMKASRTDDFSDLVDVLKPTMEELDAYGHQASDFIIQCSFDKVNCSYLDFRKVYNPFFGLCYVFNHGTDNTTVRTTSKFGSRYGLRLTLDIEYDQYLGLFSHKAGVRVSVHPHDITAFPQDFGVSAAPGQETEIGVSLETVNRQAAPFPSNCTDGSKYQLSYEGNYTITACSMSCAQNELRKRCGCVDKLVVNVTEPRCSVINRTQEACRQRVYYLFDSDSLGCDCPPSCQDHVYKMYTSSSDWPSSPYKFLLANALISTNDNYRRDDVLTRMKTTMARIHVYLDNPTMVAIEEYPSYPWDRVLADIGGLLGLFIGISACTAVEVLEFLMDVSLLSGRLLLRKNKVITPTAHAHLFPANGVKKANETQSVTHY